MERIAFIDLGSNSVRFVITEIDNQGHYSLIYQQKESIRLSEGLSKKNLLQKPAIDRALSALKAFAHMAKTLKVTHIKSIATAAVRQAKNGQDFINLVKSETGLILECISGMEEARLGFLGVVNTLDYKDFILFDLGGASIELSLVQNRKIVQSISLPIGALTLTEKYQKGSEFTDLEYLSMCRAVHKLLKEQQWLKNVSLPIIGIGGTVRALAKMDLRAIEYPVNKLHNYEINSDCLYHMLDDLRQKKLAERKKIPGLSAERADIIITGTALVCLLLKVTKAKKLIVSGCGLREGLFFDYYGQHYNDGPLIENILEHSAKNFQTVVSISEWEHIDYIIRLSKKLFWQLKRLHESPDNYLKTLYVAALLHDVGKYINYYGHPRHSAYMIINAPIYGLTHKEQVMSALIAGWSHGGNNNLVKAVSYAKLLSRSETKQLRKLAFTLALAEAIDASHKQLVREIKTRIYNNKFYLTLYTADSINHDVESVALQNLAKQFIKIYDMPLMIKWTSISHLKDQNPQL